MPYPKVDKYDREIARLSAEHSRASDVWRRFQELATENGWVDTPSERTVKRRVSELQRLFPAARRREWARFHWPAAMLEGLLPWELGREALELLHYRSQLMLDRPTVLEVKWYWRITTAAPSLSTEDASKVAATFATLDLSTQLTGSDLTEFPSEDIEWWLAYAPWADSEAAAEYEAAINREVRPIVGLTDDPEHPGRPAPERPLEEVLDDVRNHFIQQQGGAAGE